VLERMLDKEFPSVYHSVNKPYQNQTSFQQLK